MLFFLVKVVVKIRVYSGYIGVILGIMEKKMETTILGLYTKFQV